MTADLPALRAATLRAWRHVLEVHGIDASGSASMIEAVHQHAHWREGTAWHPAWQLEQQQERHHDR